MSTAWKDLPRRTRGALLAAGCVQVALFAAAQIDLLRRSEAQVRGSRLRWRLASFVNILGPLAYFRYGRT